ncbi:MAG: hypothetical protein IJT97_11370 [Bacteroidaceae bacterium]|nr:hypothetical protein [Bacteroidaceae bacterium]
MIGLSLADLSLPDSKTACQTGPLSRYADMENVARADEVAEVLLTPHGLGLIERGKDKHFYSDGAFNLIQLIIYLVKQTGPAHVFLTSYSIAEDSLGTLRRKLEKGEILSVRFIIDNRVKSMSPKPFDVLAQSFPGCYRCRAVHAKVALVYNEVWQLTVIGSQNATRNPKLERGIIHTSAEVFNFDYHILQDEFDRGST